MNVHAEIEYINDTQNVHSDICPPGHHSDGLKDEKYRKFLHLALDEWLNNSNGTGQFYIQQEGWERHE